MSRDFILGALFTYFAIFWGAFCEHFDNKRHLKYLEKKKELEENE